MTSSESVMFFPDLLKTFKFHFTVGTLSVVRLCCHLQHHVVFDAKLLLACAEAQQNSIWFFFCSCSHGWGNGVCEHWGSLDVWF